MIPHDGFWLTGALAGMSVAISSLELLASRRDYVAGGLFDCAILAHRVRLQQAWSWLAACRRLYHPGVLRGFAIIGFIAAVALVLPGTPPAIRGVVALVAYLSVKATSVFFAPTGTDGADDMNGVVLGALAVGGLSGSPGAMTCAAGFIAAHASLAYFVSGIGKLQSPRWRSGETLLGISALRLFGHSPSYHWLRAHPRGRIAMTWAIIGFECAFPLAMVAPGWLLAVMLAAGATFHLGTARLMSLNTFVWSFLATYPSIIMVNQIVRMWLFGAPA